LRFRCHRLPEGAAARLAPGFGPRAVALLGPTRRAQNRRFGASHPLSCGGSRLSLGDPGTVLLLPKVAVDGVRGDHGDEGSDEHGVSYLWCLVRRAARSD
jgi:hypothetical protein